MSPFQCANSCIQLPSSKNKKCRATKADKMQTSDSIQASHSPKASIEHKTPTPTQLSRPSETPTRVFVTGLRNCGKTSFVAAANKIAPASVRFFDIASEAFSAPLDHVIVMADASSLESVSMTGHMKESLEEFLVDTQSFVLVANMVDKITDPPRGLSHRRAVLQDHCRQTICQVVLFVGGRRQQHPRDRRLLRRVSRLPNSGRYARRGRRCPCRSRGSSICYSQDFLGSYRHEIRDSKARLPEPVHDHVYAIEEIKSSLRVLLCEHTDPPLRGLQEVTFENGVASVFGRTIGYSIVARCQEEDRDV
ncbi:hypothetical protein AAMO2058_001433000 [Amorphochlora amoebiformis]